MAEELGSGYGDRGGEDGFYELLPAPPALLGGLELLSEAAALAVRIGDGAQAALIEDLAANVERKAAEIGLETAKVADRSIVAQINKTRLRPAAGALSPRPKTLEEGVKSEPLGMGGVGIASISELDSVVGTDGQPFWRAQEYGSDHNVGRVIVGVFQPGDAPADPSESRRHPIFEVGAGGGVMVIRRPIPAKHFLRDGSAAAILFREREFRDTEIGAVAEIRTIRESLIP